MVDRKQDRSDVFMAEIETTGDGVANIRGYEDDTDEDVHVLQQYGFVSRPKKGSLGLCVGLEGNPEERVSMLFAPKQSMPEKDEETMVYSNHGQELYMKDDGSISIKTSKGSSVIIDKDGNIEIKSNGTTTVDSKGDVTLKSNQRVIIQGGPGTKKVLVGSDSAANSFVIAENLITAIDSALNAAVIAAGLITAPAGDGGTAAFGAFQGTWSLMSESIKSQFSKLSG